MVARSARQRALRTVVAVTAATATVLGVGLASAASAEAATRVAFSSAVPTWAKKANLTSTTATSTMVEGEIFLDLRDRAGAMALATAVSDPSSPSYRHYVEPQAWIDAYAPTQSDFDNAVATVKSKSGLTVTGTPASRQYIVFRGSIKSFNSAFNTTMATYRVSGENLVAPSTTPWLRSDEAHGIAGITIDQGRFLTKPASVTRTASTTGTSGGTTRTTGASGAGMSPLTSLTALSSLVAESRTLSAPKAATVKTPCSSYIGQRHVKFPKTYGLTSLATANCGYTPKQLRKAYGTSLTDGAGQTVAIIDAYASPTIQSDVNSYSRSVGEPGLTAGQYTDYSPARSTFSDKAACDYPSGWQGEQTLDVEAVHAIAPRANIVYAGGFNCGGGLDLALSKILDQGLATIVSNSYGSTGEPTGEGSSAYIAGEVNLQLQAAGQGVGLYFSSGDDGDQKANLGYPAPDFPASSPWVTAVGGTSVGLSKSGARRFTLGWGNTLNAVSKVKGKLVYKKKLPGTVFAGGAGGGQSRITSFGLPSYQSGTVPAALTPNKRRTSPDVAALADPFTGFLIGYRPIVNETTLATSSFSLGVSGGTSLAAPIVAAQIAIIQQKTGAQLGFANPALYSVAKTTPSAFRDVVPRGKPAALAYSTAGTTYAVTLERDSSLKTRKGYDNVTGLGEIKVGAAAAFATPAVTAVP